MTQSNRPHAPNPDLEIAPDADQPGEARNTEVANDELSDVAGGIDKRWVPISPIIEY